MASEGLKEMDSYYQNQDVRDRIVEHSNTGDGKTLICGYFIQCDDTFPSAPLRSKGGFKAFPPKANFWHNVSAIH